MRVTVVEYRPAWPALFRQEQLLLATALAEVAAQIEHIGSTSVPGLAAKPIIDVMIGLPDFALADSLVPKIEWLGYEYVQKYEAEMPLRRYFRKDTNGARSHHVHMVASGGEFWQRHLLFRDYLQQHPDVASAYAALKQKLAEREWHDLNDYADAKTEFIRSVEQRARAERYSVLSSNVQQPV